MRITLFLITTVLLIGCNKTSKQNYPDNNNSAKQFLDSRGICHLKDTVTSFGTRIGYKKIGNYYYEISWENNGFKRTFFDSQFCCWIDKQIGPWNFTPKFQSESENNIILISTLEFSGPSNPSPLDFYALILPKNMVDSVYTVDYFLKSHNDLLAYWENNGSNIFIINLVTQKKQEIILDPKPDGYSRSPTWPLMNNWFDNGFFYIKYESHDKEGEPITLKKSFKIII